MRWFSIRKEKIDSKVRETCERYGVTAMQIALTSSGVIGGVALYHQENTKAVLDWLTEQFDRAERKETWSLTMEFAITILVLVELLLIIFKYRS